MTGTVLVTGGSGYIAGFLIRELVRTGWTVRTTIRDMAREAAVRATLGVEDAKLSFFPADLMDDAGWAEAMAGCSHVAHVASPFPPGVPRNEDELIVPAREGALRALRFARGAGVSRFVLTSSVAAIAYGHGKSDRAFTEADWTNVDALGVTAYVKSKTIAERAARDWMAAEGGGMEFVSVNPSAVLGPVLGSDFSASIDMVHKLIDGSFPGTPDLGFAIVDVRDLAELHVRALTTPGIDGERFIGAGRFMKLNEVAQVLKARLGPEARKVPSRNLPDWLVRLIARFNPLVRAIVPELGNVRSADARHAESVLGWKTRREEDSIVDTARSLIDQGIVKV